MKNFLFKSITDDGKGRVLLKPDRSVDGVKLLQKEDWHEVKDPGDYAWTTWVEFEMLVMVCPFCGFEAPMPWLIKIICKNPLDILHELYCKKCSVSFYVINGAAYRSWIVSWELRKILDGK